MSYAMKDALNMLCMWIWLFSYPIGLMAALCFGLKFRRRVPPMPVVVPQPEKQETAPLPVDVDEMPMPDDAMIREYLGLPMSKAPPEPALQSEALPAPAPAPAAGHSGRSGLAAFVLGITSVLGIPFLLTFVSAPIGLFLAGRSIRANGYSGLSVAGGILCLSSLVGELAVATAAFCL